MATPKTARAGKRRIAGNIRRERHSSRNAIAAELERLRKERQGLLASNELYRALLWEFLSTHCASLDLRERATTAVGCIPTGMP